MTVKYNLRDLFEVLVGANQAYSWGITNQHIANIIINKPEIRDQLVIYAFRAKWLIYENKNH